MSSDDLYGLTANEVDFLVRLAASACDERDGRPWRFRGADPLDRALLSFSDPDEVLALGKRAWVAIRKANGL